MTNNEKRERQIRRKRAMLRRVHKKLSVAFSICVIILLILVGVIFNINYSKGEEYKKVVLDHQAYTVTTIPYRRGQIQDRNGIVLAYSQRVYNLILDPKIILSNDKYKEPTFSALIKCFSLERSTLEQILNEKPDSHYEKLLTQLTDDQISEFKQMKEDKSSNIEGVWFEDSYLRQYPFKTLACDVIGFASSVNGGELGLESYYNDELTGTDGIDNTYIDESLEIQHNSKDAVDGNNIVTTIDFNVQSIIENKIIEYNNEKPSKNTAVVVMDPNNGEVLGMASYPNFDLNNPRDMSSIITEEELSNMSDEDVKNSLYSLWSNFCISDIYEPGSTFKPFTVAAGLDAGVIHDGDTFLCNGYEEVGGFKIKCHAYNRGGHGLLTLEQALMQSCNPSMMQIAAKLGGVKFGQYQRAFGFGSKTGIDLPGEENGLIKDENMSATDLATNSFGQNFNVNMIQMCAGFSSLVNGGYYYQPHIVKKIEKATGETVDNIESTVVRQTITSSTSKLINQYLRETVDTGLGIKAGVTGYSIGGKTGTAQKIPRSDNKWLVSFIGSAPAENPKFIIYCIIDEPFGTNGTSGSSADVLKLSHDILEELLPYMNVYKDTTEEPVDTSGAPDELTVDIGIE